MNSILVIFILYNRTFVPEFAISYLTEEACISKTKDYTAIPHSNRLGKCFAPVESVKLLPADPDANGHVMINVLTQEQCSALGAKEFEVYLGEKAR